MEKKKQTLQQLFAAPGNEWRAKPFWSWNGELEKEELIRQVGVMKEMGWGGHFMHSRSGLATEYLGDEWFDLINAVTDATQELGMESWLYDEDRWPSGSAGGKVTIDPQYRMKSLKLIESAPEAYAPAADDVAAWLGYVGENGLDLWCALPVTAQSDLAHLMRLNPQRLPGSWRVLRFAIEPDACNSNYNGTTYIDTMSEKATRRFIELTHEEYAKRCGDRMGSSIYGIFTDEPHRGHAMDDLRTLEDGTRTCKMAWTDDLFEEYEKRYGADPMPLLPRLFYRWQGVAAEPFRLHYFDLADNLFLERFAKPLDDWCKAHGIHLTGHVLHEDALSNQTVPQGSLMRFYEYEGVPGVDVLTAGNRCYWIVKQLASSCRQLGKPWLLSELYGCTGWEFDFRGHKNVGDWQALFGINLRCPHLSWFTMEGQSKRDYPASILHQSAWYKDYSLVEDYFARMAVLLSAAPACDVLVLNPIESVWALAHLGWAKWISNVDPTIEKYEENYRRMFHFLTGSHIDFDYGEEEMMSRMAAVERDEAGRPVLRVGQMCYRTVVVGGMLTMRPTTLALLKEFAAAGGSIVFAGELPTMVDALPNGEIAQLAAGCTCVPFEAAPLSAAVRAASAEFVSITGEGAQEVFVQVRRHPDGSIAAVALNTDRDAPRRALTLRLAVPDGLQPQLWDLTTGARYDAAALTKQVDGLCCLPVELEAGGTAAFVFAADAESLPACPAAGAVTGSTALPVPGYAYRLDEENVCVLDLARWRWAGGEWSAPTEVLKADNAIRDVLGIERRGGEMLQPWFSKLHHTECYGQLELEYSFTVDALPAGTVTLAAERPDVMHYAVNGVPVAPDTDGSFWVDVCFKRMTIPAGVLKTGVNTITVTTAFTRNSNVEALYLLGGFGVRVDGRTAALTTLPETLRFGSLKEQGLPFYTGALTYILPARLWGAAAPDARVILKPQKPHGALVRVTTPSGTVRLGWDPMEADITDAVRAGADVELTLVGTRRNTFGPLHMLPVISEATGPMHFVTEGKSWSDDYAFIESGIEGAVIECRK